MNIQALQIVLDSNSVPGASVPVDLLKVARSIIQKQRNRNGKGQMLSNAKLRLVLDGECCLDRLYGGYFSDWACGGQWNRMIQFLEVFIQASKAAGLELAVFFNGSQESLRRAEWIQNQLSARQKVNNVLKHIATKGTPPPKIWWIPPACLRTSLRMALRHLNVTVISSTDDHHQEVIAFCRESSYHGLIADDAEYAVFDPPRYFSSEQLKLTYKGSLDTKEYLTSELLKGLNLQPERLCILAALLGNHILTESDLADFYKKINPNPNKINVDQSIRAIANFVKDLPSIELDDVAQQVFGSPTDPKCSIFKQSVQYYVNGTKDGFLHYKPIKPTKDEVQNDQIQSTTSDVPSTTEDETTNMSTSRFASETAESEQESLNVYKEATANAKAAPQIVIEPPASGVQGSADDANNSRTEEEQSNGHSTVNGTHNLLISSSSSSSSSSATSPSHINVEQIKETDKSTTIPITVPEVMRTASERHQKGLMSPYIYQILANGEIKLPVLLEDENNKEFSSIHVIYRPVRQMVYAILFNLHHRLYLATKSKEKGETDKIEVSDVIVKEWVWSKSNPFQTPELVKAEQIGWGVPTIQRLWFGTGIDDKRRRLRGFLTCMRSDTPLMLNTAYVPQHLLVMACVLRYIMTFSDKTKILRRQELDAFIVQAFSPELMNAQYLQDLQISLVTTRGVQLASLFMAGVETALLANDACGAPIPWLMCCPWLYFDGKLFHHTLARATVAKNLLDLCGGNIDRDLKVERMRKAILEGVNVVFARPLPPITQGIRIAPPQAIPPAGCPITPDGLMRSRGGAVVGAPQRSLMRRPIPSRGGQLEIAGVVVGSWGPNFGQPGRIPQPLQGGPQRRIPPQVTSIGGPKYNLRPLNTLGVRPNVSMTRGNGRTQAPSRGGKKTQMKVTSKKMDTFKKANYYEMKNGAGRKASNAVTSGLSNTFANLKLTKEVLKIQDQFNVSENGKGVVNGQGDAFKNAAHLVEND
ncbi:constitutive coactivator of PPAR-gamma-like protein 1 homolog isoform X1 [Nasonia vitripennis]|uniref:Constitutive coactivator of PPAR-gamma-like protein 1 homolog n=1 Tax=Nasonia vitripennis TaxID=7425 RepID=A0A7M7R2X9_NASVI|nr:constitutive coactivator of PPAR-gamma-like protein 1 homolog isoform X1 [Nasonia vitripennis]XP_031778258.1 constitutive coactivator of PPAR-gamma-like protein 1 homolog isoform X1 [Nasonia vitripennis]XP_031778259.1 constitutive coactivator of PPAR-gamma-like protein 1 homolog isoform X1 [Nasonia vitripennis]XP_031778260.1 constitutive coactivator of PPAR-gamma-like protein 1 homolog isoform X1 [Nasonia vitripennis]XP_032457358.1 constitutive coactivator of PPAR-gamma-like protein 1 homolo